MTVDLGSWPFQLCPHYIHSRSLFSVRGLCPSYRQKITVQKHATTELGAGGQNGVEGEVGKSNSKRFLLVFFHLAGWKNTSISGPLNTFATRTLIFLLWKKIKEKLVANMMLKASRQKWKGFTGENNLEKQNLR